MFSQVIQTLSRSLQRLPKFKPGKVPPDKGGDESQVDKWKYQSGYMDGIAAVLDELAPE